MRKNEGEENKGGLPPTPKPKARADDKREYWVGVSEKREFFLERCYLLKNRKPKFIL